MTKIQEKVNVLGKNTLYIKEVIDKIAQKNDLLLENLNVNEMDFSLNSLNNLDLDIDLEE